MNEQKIKSEMRRAETMRRTADANRAEYWTGYIRGLRRAHHGKKFGTEEEHEKWSSLSDESRRERGLGYRDGLAYGEISEKIGRPALAPGEKSIQIQFRLPESDAAKLGDDPNDRAREIIREWLGKQNA